MWFRNWFDKSRARNNDSKFDHKPCNNVNELCPGCGDKLTVITPSRQQQEFHAVDLNVRYGYDLQPRDIMFLGLPCPCGEKLKVFYRNFTDST